MALNRCAFIGNLGADPDIRTMQNGDKVANFRLAVTERWKDKNGDKQERTEWIACVVFGGLTKVVEGYLHKGSKVYVEGKMTTRKWQDASGADRYTTEINVREMEMLDAPKEREVSHQWMGGSADLEDSIPF